MVYKRISICVKVDVRDGHRYYDRESEVAGTESTGPLLAGVGEFEGTVGIQSLKEKTARNQ